MKYYVLLFASLLTLPITFPALANGRLSEDSPSSATIMEDDLIMRQSLNKQGVPAPAFQDSPQRLAQRQEDDAVTAKEIDNLEKKVQALQRQVDYLKEQNKEWGKMQQREETSSDTNKDTNKQKVTRVELENKLRSAQAGGTIGKYSIMKGKTTAKAFSFGETAKEREIPALQVCATMADANKLSREDFAFLGFDKEVADKIVSARNLMGEFSSSKQISAVEGVDPETYDVVREEILAIEEQKLAE